MTALEIEMYAVLKMQHEAIDRLFAALIVSTREGNQVAFLPSQSGQPWTACKIGSELIMRLEKERQAEQLKDAARERKS